MQLHLLYKVNKDPQVMLDSIDGTFRSEAYLRLQEFISEIDNNQNILNNAVSSENPLEVQIQKPFNLFSISAAGFLLKI